MSLIKITGILNQIYESIGLPPLILIFVMALFLFVFIFGLVILIKVRNIRRDLIVVNKNLDALNIRMQDQTVNPFVLQKQAVNKAFKERSKRLHRLSDIYSQHRNRGRSSHDGRDEKLINSGEETEYIKNKIINLLKIKDRAISYSEIIKNLSKDFLDCDFDLILNELDQLKKQGKIVDHYSAGKLYYQIKKNSK